jgi:hypothetical protein
MIFLIVSCASLRLTPHGCKSEGVWGAMPEEWKKKEELKLTEEYFVGTTDKEVKLNDILKKNKISCSEVKYIRVEIKSVFFVKRELKIFIIK